MKLAILTYNYVSYAPEGMPLNWPAEILEIEDDALAPNEDWMIKTKEEYIEYLTLYQNDYDIYKVNQTIVQPTQDKIALQKIFGQALSLDISVKFRTDGLTNDEIKTASLALKDILMMLTIGELQVALTLLNDFEPIQEFSQETKDFYINKLNEFLGL